MKIRAATLDDLQALRSLELELIEHERTIIPFIKKGEDVKYQDIPALISNKENTLVLVMEINDEIIGCGFGQIRNNAEYYTESRFGYIGMMSISKAHRGNGYAGEIIKELIKWFKTRHITEIKLKVFSDNTGAIRAYEKLGFEGFSLDMRLEL